MPRFYHSSAARCPFYRGEDGVNVLCAGAMKAETTKLFFRDKERASAHKKQFCRRAWEECELAKIIAKEDAAK